MTNEEQKFRKFAEWVAEEVFNELWEVNCDAFAEIACRKLAKLGIVKATKTKWILEKSPEWEQEPCIQEKQANADKIDAVYIDGFKAGYSQARFDLEQAPCTDAISRQAAIGIIQNWLNYDTGYSWGEKNVMKCTIDELMDLPPVSTEKTDAYKQGWHDAIGKALNEAYDVVIDGERFSVVQEETLLGLGMSMELPPVSTEKTGRWIKIKPYPLQMHDYECSECGHETDDNTEKHCSECGAKMEVVECEDAISRQREKNISKGFEDFIIKSLQRQAESEE